MLEWPNGSLKILGILVSGLVLTAAGYFGGAALMQSAFAFLAAASNPSGVENDAM